VDAELRLQGYRQAILQAGFSTGADLEIQGDFSEHSGYLAAAQLLERTPRPTAVFAANDNMAVGLLSALHNAGLEVPRQMALVGFDDIVIARYLNPPLTTVHVDMFGLGQRAVQLLLASCGSSATGGSPAAGRSDEAKGSRKTADAPPCVHETVPADLVVRHSCGSAGRQKQTVRQHGGPCESGQERAVTSKLILPKR
jgi:LacI family transcriptional regulator